MIVKLVPIEQLIRKVVSDFSMGSVDVPWEEMVDWVAYGLQHIAAYAQYEPKTATLKIVDYKAQLPKDFFRVNADVFYLPHKITMDTIYVGYKTGDLELQYLALPVDERGFPLIPDSTEYFNALTWLIISKLILRGDFVHKDINFQYADERWTKGALSARADANMPDLQGMQRRANDYRKMKYPTNAMRDQFRNLGMEDNLRRDGNN